MATKLELTDTEVHNLWESLDKSRKTVTLDKSLMGKLLRDYATLNAVVRG